MTTKEKIHKSIERLFSINELKCPEIKPELSLTDDFGFDSLDFVDLWLDIEHNFNISVPMEEIKKIKTVQDVYNTVERHTNEVR